MPTVVRAAFDKVTSNRLASTILRRSAVDAEVGSWRVQGAFDRRAFVKAGSHEYESVLDGRVRRNMDAPPVDRVGER
jgi:hypothetical protein